MSKAKERLEICKKCEYYKHKLKMCQVCKCIMPIKTRIPLMKCPVNKW